MSQKHWLVIGRQENWKTALSQPIPVWGLKERYWNEFQLLSQGDFIWMYVTKPVGGIIGVGSVKETYKDRQNLIWPEEIQSRSVIWPFRFRIQVLKVLPTNHWSTSQIYIKDFRLIWQQGFQQLSEEMAIKIFERAKKIFSVHSFENLIEGASISKAQLVGDGGIERIPEPVQELHSIIQNQIAEIGKLQSYHTQVEYSLSLHDEKENIDVVWKREINGVPTFAFEIELTGAIEKVIDRLLFAFRLWNSKPRMVVSEELKSRVHSKIKTSSGEFGSIIRTYTPKQISQLLESKKRLRDMEKELGLY
ncbi:MAG: hypothetical protein N2115_02260 [bacterium]|nr:hypothetical protein [bacterium]